VEEMWDVKVPLRRGWGVPSPWYIIETSFKKEKKDKQTK